MGPDRFAPTDATVELESNLSAWDGDGDSASP